MRFLDEIEECSAINVLDSLVINELQKACDSNMFLVPTKDDLEEEPEEGEAEAEPEDEPAESAEPKEEPEYILSYEQFMDLNFVPEDDFF